MTMHTQPVTLTCGVTVTVTAWRLADIAAHAADFHAVVDAISAPLRGLPAPLPPQDTLPVLARVVRLSLTRPEDAHLVRACDLPPLLAAVWEVNGLGALAKKSLALQLRAQHDQKTVSHPSP